MVMNARSAIMNYYLSNRADKYADAHETLDTLRASDAYPRIRDSIIRGRYQIRTPPLLLLLLPETVADEGEYLKPRCRWKRYRAQTRIGSRVSIRRAYQFELFVLGNPQLSPFLFRSTDNPAALSRARPVSVR